MSSPKKKFEPKTIGEILDDFVHLNTQLAQDDVHAYYFIKLLSPHTFIYVVNNKLCYLFII